MGAAEMTPAVRSCKALLEDADGKLYKARDGGRNRIVVLRCNQRPAAARVRRSRIAAHSIVSGGSSTIITSERPSSSARRLA